MNGALPKSYSSYELSKKERTRFLFACGLGLFTAAYLFYHSLILIHAVCMPGISGFEAVSKPSGGKKKDAKSKDRSGMYCIPYRRPYQREGKCRNRCLKPEKI